MDHIGVRDHVEDRPSRHDGPDFEGLDYSGGKEADVATDRKVSSVCEHFSHRPLSLLDCLCLLPGQAARAVRPSPFGRCVGGEIPDASPWDEAFDLVICDHNYHLADDVRLLADQIFRLLKPDGMCYFSGQRGFPWSRLLRNSDQRCFRTVQHLRKCLDDFWIHDYGPLIKQYPEVFQRDQISQSRVRASLGGIFFGDSDFVWMLTKKR